MGFLPRSANPTPVLNDHKAVPKHEPLRDSQGRTFSEYVTDRVTEAMVAAPMSMREISKASGIPKSRLGRRFNEGQSFTAEELGRIAEGIGIRPAELLNLEGFDPV